MYAHATSLIGIFWDIRVATNDNGKGVTSAQGPATQWRATGKPASWGAWSVLPTGNNNEAKAEFFVLGDGKELWKSEELKKSDGTRAFKVQVKNVKRLMLRVRRVGEGGRVYADWVDARLTK